MLDTPSAAARHVQATGRAASHALAPLVAVVSVLLLGANYSVKFGVTLGAVPVIILAPLWLTALSKHRGSGLVIGTAGAAVVAGLVLSRVSSTDHVTGRAQTISAAMLVVTGFGAVGVLLWSSHIIGRTPTVVLYGFAFAVSQLADRGSWEANPWKQGFAFPVTVVAVALVGRARTVWPTLMTLAAAGLLSITNDYRSFFGFCVVTALLVIWQESSRSTSPARHRFAPVLLLGALGFATYYIVSTLLVDGYLGPEVQERSIEQIDESGSLLLGGRPEWTATLRLMAEHLSGFGFGVVPNAADVNTGDAGLLSINVNPDYGYNDYMFVGQFRLHAIAADLWAGAGIAGILLAAVVVWTLVRGLTLGLESRRLDALTIIFVVIGFWDMAFSPIYTSLKDITLGLFLVLSIVTGLPGGPADPPNRIGATRRRPRRVDR